MNRTRWVLGCGLLGLLAVACGSTDSKATGPKMGAATADCGTVQEPLELVLKDVKPAPGSSLPNADIVHGFTVVGKLVKLELAFAHAGSHTAGLPIPATTNWTYGVSGADTVYAALPMSWTSAPGHVELTLPSLLMEADGCVFSLPTPMFSYDITAP